jgi:deoxyribodipyrimidine photo-lyase
MTILFIHRRDLRIVDNIGLNFACQLAKATKAKILPVFIFNHAQVDRKQNPYFGDYTFHFMLECLQDLLKQYQKELNVKLSCFYAHNEGDIDVIKWLCTKLGDVTDIVFNQDVTPFAHKRDNIMKRFCDTRGINYHTIKNEYSLFDVTSMEKPYKVFGAFYKKYINTHVDLPTLTKLDPSLFQEPNKNITSKHGYSENKWNMLYDHTMIKQPLIHGGRVHGLERLHLIDKKQFSKYSTERDYPCLENKTTLLSAYLKYGCISIREAYWSIRKAYGLSSALLRELFWRAFYEQMVYHFPLTLQGQVEKAHKNLPWPAKQSYSWQFDKTIFAKVTKGKTGVPIIDASIRCLHETGFMHNRLRMILCMFVIRHLKQDWREYERWFATKVIDYYPPSNRGGWEWAVIYRFKLSPWTQTKRFDKECTFIKKWIPELEKVDNKIILYWDKSYKIYPDMYLAPIT